MNSRLRLALLIDAENVSYKKAPEILSQLTSLGEPVIRIAFGDWTTANLNGWQEVAGEHGIRLDCRQPCTQYKNGSDIALAVEAVDLLHLSRPDGFAIVSGDSDFTPLVTRLRERLLPVYVFGGENTPRSLRTACTEFFQLGTEREEPQDNAAVPAPPRKTPSSKKVATTKATTRPSIQPFTSRVEKRVHAAIKESAGNDGWATISSMAKQLGSGTRPNNFGHATWTKLFVGRPGFEIRNAKKPNAAVRSTV